MHDGIPIPEAAAALGLSERTIRRRIKAGTLDAYEVHTVHGMAWRVVLPAGDGGQGVSMEVGTVAKSVDSDSLGVVLAEVAALRAELATLRPEYGPRDPGPPVALRREEYPTAVESERVGEAAPAQTRWERFKAWLGGGA